MKKKQNVKKQLLNFLEDRNFSLSESDLKEWMDLAEQYDAQESPVRKIFRNLKRMLDPKKHMKLGKIYVYDDLPSVKGIDKRVAWSADEYLAAIIRDYIRMIEKTEYHIGAAAFDEFPYIPHNKMINSKESEEEIEASKRWHDILLQTADMFDEYIKATREINFDFK
ncbi:MAG: hypothetical protein IKB70_05360, partial [Bacilli bacterium]|nr:hypothetical protein [Bacilli bacterium]